LTPLILVSSSPKDGNKDAGVEVTAEGTGSTAEEALKDAFRQAIRQVVGAIVDAETLVMNDEVVYDKVLTHSAGVVKTYKKLSEEQKNGLFRVTIKAIVEKRSLVAQLRAAKAPVTEVDGKSLFAELVTELEGLKTAKELVAKALEGFPMNCIQAEAVMAEKPVLRDDERVTVKVRVKISVNPKDYKAFSERLVNILEKLKTCKAEGWMKFARVSNGHNVLALVAQDIKNYRGGWPKNKIAIAVCTNASQVSDPSLWADWSVYWVDKSIRDALASVRNAVEVNLSVIDSDGRPVTTDSFSGCVGRPSDHPNAPCCVVTPIYPCYNYLHEHGSVKTDPNWQRHNIFFISPLFIISNLGPECELRYVTRAIKVEREIDLTLEELKSVRSIKCKVTAHGVSQALIRSME